MKRIFTLFLAIVMIVCMFVGCGKSNDKVETPTDNTTNATEPSIENTEPNENPTNIDGRQELWNKVFENKEYKFASKSYKLVSDIMSITYLTDGTAQYLDVSGKDDNDNTIGMGFLAINTETAYLHRYGVEDNVTIDSWSKCVNMDSEDVNIDDTMDETNEDNSFVEAFKSIQSVEYVESIGNIDKLIVYYIPTATDSSDTGSEVIYDVTLEVEYNGKKGTYRYTETMCDDAISCGTTSSNFIEEFSWNDWEFDKETLKLTKNDETIQCVLVEDHLSADTNSNDEVAPIEVYIDSTTYEIHKMVMDVTAESLSSIEYVKCDDVVKEIAVPETTEEVDLATAVMEFGFMFIALALNSALNG